MTIKIFEGLGHVFIEVAGALIPLLIFFVFFQLVFLKLPMSKVRDIVVGMVLTFFGLAFFLQGVHIGFLPAGLEMGKLLGALEHTWLIIPIGFVFGFVATYAEPAVRILNHEVDKVSGGYIPQKVLLYTLSLGVAVSIAISMVRILLGIPLWYILLPGYILALIMIRFNDRTFTAVAFDSGGVATGPMTVTFIMAMAVGIASVTEGRDPLADGFGMVALVALAPILAVLTLGALYGRKEREND